MNRGNRGRLVVALGMGPLVLGAGCKVGERSPAWARMPVAGAGGSNGDSTITGEPAHARRFAKPPVIDGKLDEAEWQTATLLGPFVDPGEGQAVAPNHPVAAFARVGWDAQNLYLGFVVRDEKPDAPFAPSEVDPHVWGKSSAVEIMLQPGDPGDNRDYYEVQIDTAGAVFDSRWDNYNLPITGSGPDKIFGHQDFRFGGQHAAFVERGQFYAIETTIPFSSLSPEPPERAHIPPQPGDVWRLQLYSFRDGQRRALAWSPVKHEGNFHRASRFGRIRFE